MKKIYLVADASVAIAIVSVFLFVGQTNSFQSKIDELSSMNVYDFEGKPIGVIECKLSWEEWPAYDQELCYKTTTASLKYEVRQAAS